MSDKHKIRVHTVQQSCIGAKFKTYLVFLTFYFSMTNDKQKISVRTVRQSCGGNRVVEAAGNQSGLTAALQPNFFFPPPLLPPP